MGSTATRKLAGFAALGGEVPYINPNAIKIVGVDLPQTDENWFAYCPRADEPLEDEWVEDIRKNGVRQPVDGCRDGDAILLLEGRRRVRAARIVWKEQEKAGVPEGKRITLRVHVHKGTPEVLFAYNVASDNRKEKSASQRAALMAHAKKFGADDKAVAEMFGCTVVTVKNMLAFLDLAPSVQKAVDEGFPLHAAIKLRDMPREKQKEALLELEAAGATKGAAAENGIAAKKAGRKVTGDRTRMRSRLFIERWKTALEKADLQKYSTLVEMLAFVLGGPVPEGVSESFVETLVEAGFREKKEGKKRKAA